MTLTEISQRLLDLAMGVENYTDEQISEELLVMVDCLSDLEQDVVGTLAGIAKGLRESKKAIKEDVLPNMVFNTWEDRIKFFKGLSGM